MAAGKGGGSWKVAYADFVTAMMAFFLVMWIGAQDQKIRQSVANYFVDPSGVSKVPARTGAVHDTLTYGAVPGEEKVNMGKGTRSFDTPRDWSPQTTKVYNWLREDPKRLAEFRQLARESQAAAEKSPEVTQGRENADVVAAKHLALNIRVKVSGGVAATTGLYQDLLIEVMNDVNWKQLADELLRQQ